MGTGHIPKGRGRQGRPAAVAKRSRQTSAPFCAPPRSGSAAPLASAGRWPHGHDAHSSIATPAQASQTIPAAAVNRGSMAADSLRSTALFS